MHREFDLAAAVCSRSSNGATRGDIPFVFRSECEIDSARSFRIRFVIGLFFFPPSSFFREQSFVAGFNYRWSQNARWNSFFFFLRYWYSWWILIFASMHVIQLYVYDINFARKIRGRFIARRIKYDANIRGKKKEKTNWIELCENYFEFFLIRGIEYFMNIQSNI